MASYRFNTKRVCCKQIRFDIEDGSLHNIRFLGGGCEGNLRAVAALLEGHDAHEAIEVLSGMPCGNRGTSCGDQFAKAVEVALGEVSDAGQTAAEASDAL